MAKGEKRKKSGEPAAAVGSLERYEVVEVHRSELKNAPYNPRTMSEDERARLKKIILKHGLVAPPSWNRRTGNIVGGHQRVSVLDAAYGTSDYRLKVAAVGPGGEGVDEVAERELNLALNNAQAQGDWDLGKLEAMFKDTPTIDFAGTGFDAGEVFRLFGASPFETRADDHLSEVAQRIREARERQERVRQSVRKREESDFYLVVVFRDDADRLAFTEAVGWDDNRYQSGAQIRVIAAHWIASRVRGPENAGAPPGDGGASGGGELELPAGEPLDAGAGDAVL